MHMHKTILLQLAIAVSFVLNSSNLMVQTDEGTTPQSRHRQYTKGRGKIGVTSEGEDKGSTFWLWVPCGNVV